MVKPLMEGTGGIICLKWSSIAKDEPLGAHFPPASPYRSAICGR